MSNLRVYISSIGHDGSRYANRIECNLEKKLGIALSKILNSMYGIFSGDLIDLSGIAGVNFHRAVIEECEGDIPMEGGG